MDTNDLIEGIQASIDNIANNLTLRQRELQQHSKKKRLLMLRARLIKLGQEASTTGMTATALNSRLHDVFHSGPPRDEREIEQAIRDHTICSDSIDELFNELTQCQEELEEIRST